VVADARGGAGLGAAVDRDAFAERAVVANDHVGRLAAEGQVLGQVADDGAGVHLAARAEGGVAENDGVGGQHAAVAQADRGGDVGIGADLDVGAELGAGFDDGGGVDHGEISGCIFGHPSAGGGGRQCGRAAPAFTGR